MDENIKTELIRKKRFLKQYKYIKLRIAKLEEKLSALDARIKSIKAPSYSGMPRGGIPVTMEDMIADKDILIDRIRNLRNKSNDIKKRVLKEIDRLDDVRHAEVLEYYFIECMSFGDIGEELGYTERHVVRLYTEAVEQLVLMDMTVEQL